MKTSHIVTISAAGAIATLLIGGGAFAAGNALGQSELMPASAEWKIQERFEQRGPHEDSPSESDERGQRADHSHGPRDHSGERKGGFSGQGRMADHRGPGHSSTPGATP